MDFFNIKDQYIAAVYVRLSKEDEDLAKKDDKTESNSIQNQKELIHKYLENQPNIKIYDDYVDDGFTGTNFERPEFMRMRKDILEGRVNMVVVKDLSRFGRDYVEAGNYIRNIFRNLDIRFISILDHFDSMTATSTDYNLLLPVRNFVNDQYSSDISNKVRGNQGAMRAAGKYIGPYVGYGFLKSPKDKHQIIVDDYAWENILKMITWKYLGYSNNRIADKLNALGVLSPAEYKKTLGINYKTGFQQKPKTKWSSVAVKRVLSNPMNKGVMIQGRRKRVNYKIRSIVEKPEGQWDIIENAVSPKLTDYSFENIQRLLEADIRIAPGKENVYLFAGKLFCADCGRNMIRRKNKENIFYICTTYNRGDNCSRHSINTNELASAVLSVIKKHIELLVELESILSCMDFSVLKIEDIISYDEEIQNQYNELSRYYHLKELTVKDLREGIITDEDCEAFVANYDMRCNEILCFIKEIKEDMRRIAESQERCKEWIAEFKQYRNVTRLDRTMLVLLVDKILVYENGRVEILFRFQNEYELAVRLVKAVSLCSKQPEYMASQVKAV